MSDPVLPDPVLPDPVLPDPDPDELLPPGLDAEPSSPAREADPADLAEQHREAAVGEVPLRAADSGDGPGLEVDAADDWESRTEVDPGDDDHR